ncbi:MULTISPECIES: hypothetical protein [Bradyrhizobium]|uniref:hypothetical protein n=1 Tax=Bradyrhizobium TaxID=374 RepID=UPI000555B370|nr:MULTISPECIES: hypothetical protein [unclassified Bradyrhizobium]MDA9424719.1 hypothetical protein [Bradyrhizobium sp. CCBAU 53380]
MHPLPHKDQLDYLVGSELTQFTIGHYEVRFLLSGPNVDAGITVSAPFYYSDRRVEETFEPNKGCRTQNPVRFHALLGQKLCVLDVTPEGDQPSLKFDDGQTLTISFEIGGPYESGSIQGNGKLWIF